MKFKMLIVNFCVLLFSGCAKPGVAYYQETYKKHKELYLQAEILLNDLLGKNDSLFKITVEFTGRRIDDYQYSDDSNIHDFVPFPEQYEGFFDHFMYDQELKYITCYRDSIKCVYSGRNQDIIVHYLSGYKPAGGFLIDTNMYLFFEGTRNY